MKLGNNEALESIIKEFKKYNKTDKYTGSMAMFLDEDIFDKNIHCV